MGLPCTSAFPPPQVGDTLRVRPAADRRDARATGVVTRVRLRAGRWVAAELEIAGQRRWFLKGELELPPPAPLPAPSPAPPMPAPPSLPRRVAPPADFLRIPRRVRRGWSLPALFIYVGWALLARWQATAGPVVRVDLARHAERLTISAASEGRYVLDAASGRQPNIHCDGARDLVTIVAARAWPAPAPDIHCDGARNLVTLPDGRYRAAVAGVALVVGEVMAGAVGQER